MQAPQANQANTSVPVDWSHVKQEDLDELNEILTSIVHGQPRLLVFAHTIGADMVTQAFEQALKNHVPQERHEIHVPADFEFVNIYPAFTSPPPDRARSVIAGNALESPGTGGLVKDTRNLQVQSANAIFQGTAQTHPPQLPAQTQTQASTSAFLPAQAAASNTSNLTRPVVHPPHVSPQMHDPYISPGQAGSKTSGPAIGFNPFDFANKQTKARK